MSIKQTNEIEEYDESDEAILEALEQSTKCGNCSCKKDSNEKIHYQRKKAIELKLNKLGYKKGFKLKTFERNPNSETYKIEFYHNRKRWNAIAEYSKPTNSWHISQVKEIGERDEQY